MSPRQPPRKPPRRAHRPALPSPSALPRAMRHMRAGLLVLLAVSIVVLAVLLIRIVDLRGEVVTATEETDATVVSSRVTDSAVLVDVRWTHDGAERTATLRYDDGSGPGPGSDDAGPEAGSRIPIAFDPERPDRVFANGDTTLSALSSLVADVLLVLVVLVVVNVLGSVRWLRRRRLTSRRGEPVAVRRVKVRLRLVERSYLVLSRGGGELWVPVYWDPALEQIGAGDEPETTVTAYGDLRARGLVGFVVGDALVWPSGGARVGQPRGEVREGPSGQDGPVSLARQFRADGGLLFPAPLLGLLWAYVDDSGPGGFALSTVFFVGILSWLPTYYGSDPT